MFAYIVLINLVLFFARTLNPFDISHLLNREVMRLKLVRLVMLGCQGLVCRLCLGISLLVIARYQGQWVLLSIMCRVVVIISKLLLLRIFVCLKRFYFFVIIIKTGSF